MIETAIVGGGLCGLALARSLRRQGRSFQLFEARHRLGGRILSKACGSSGLMADLGATWFWPQTQALVATLVEELGLLHFAQYDCGVALHLADPDKQPEALKSEAVHAGARRLVGGIQRLIDALAADLPSDALLLDHALKHVFDRGDHVEFAMDVAGQRHSFLARRIVLALPPRLAQAHIAVTPALDEPTLQAMCEAPTWMAAQAKAVFSYRRPIWREAGQSGNGFVTHEQAVFGEIFDACDNEPGGAALGGFLALSPELRHAFGDGLPLLMENQMEQMFGQNIGPGEFVYQDWADESDTCSALDITQPARHIDSANPLLRRALWDGKLYLGSSETAARNAGYLDGALDAARRIARDIIRKTPQPSKTAAPIDTIDRNADSLARFSRWVALQNDVVFATYRRQMNQALARQQREQLTQRAMLAALDEFYQTALATIGDLPFDRHLAAVERGRSQLTPQAQKPFADFLRQFLDDVIAYNRTSCALSNFPNEHRLSKEYEQAILQDIAATWRDFSLALNRSLVFGAALAPDAAAATPMTAISG